MRIIYSLLFYLFIPYILLRLLWRSIKVPAYRQRWSERFAFYRDQHRQGAVWFHAVSVGEAEALFPLLRRFRQRYPDLPVLVTTTTPTGSARVQSVMKDEVMHVYIPYDLPDGWLRFFNHFRPKLAVIMETEIWPNLFTACGDQQIPLLVINARLSEKSANGYRKVPNLIRRALSRVTLIVAQTQEDADRYLSIGAPLSRVKTLGNMKFDVEIPASLVEAGLQIKKNAFKNRFVWLIASTHNNEEAILIDLYRQIKQTIPELLLIIVPRHPERFISVAQLCQQHGLRVVTRTSGNLLLDHADVYLVDTMGELKLFYAACDVAFVGGSLVPVGGHNVLEAAAVGAPVMFGPHMANFKEIADNILMHDAAIQCQSTDEITETILSLYASPEMRNRLIVNSRNFLLANQGAVVAILELISETLDSS